MNVCGGGRDSGNSCGVHFFATSKEGPWYPSSGYVYNNAVILANGTVTRFQTRQRPQLISAPTTDGAIGTPQYMINGGSFTEDNNDLTICDEKYRHV